MIVRPMHEAFCYDAPCVHTLTQSLPLLQLCLANKSHLAEKSTRTMLVSIYVSLPSFAYATPTIPFRKPSCPFCWQARQQCFIGKKLVRSRLPNSAAKAERKEGRKSELHQISRQKCIGETYALCAREHKSVNDWGAN